MQIDEGRKKQAAAAKEAIERKMAEVERQKSAIAERAAAAERKRAEADAVKAGRVFEARIEKLEAQRARETVAQARAMQAQVRAARTEATRPLSKTISALQADLRAGRAAASKAAATAAANIRRLTREIALVGKEAAKDRAHMQREVTARVRAAKEVAEQGRLRVIDGLKAELETQKSRAERDMEQMKRLLGEAKQKLEAREQRHFGPEGEEGLIVALRSAFPKDEIVHRGKGGDVIHKVNDGGQTFGTIVYECKKTTSFQKEYTRQLKKAMELHKTKYGLLVSQKLPAKALGMCTANGVLVVEPHLAVHVAGILRDAAVALGRARMSDQGKAAKTEELYRYLRSDDFANSIARIDDKIRELRESLGKEKTSHDTWWRMREQHYATILREACGIDARVNEILEGRGMAVRANVRQFKVPAKLLRSHA